MSFHVFVVEDEADYAALLGYRLQKNHKLTTRFFPDGESALECLHEKPDLVLLDVMMPGIGGFETLRTIRAKYPSIPVVVVTSQLSKHVALRAMEYGAYDFVIKGYDDMQRIPDLVQQLHDRKQMLKAASSFMKPRRRFWTFAGMLAESHAMESVFRQARKSLSLQSHIALLGEPGAGKTLLAQILQRAISPRLHPLLSVDCQAADSYEQLFGTAATEDTPAQQGVLEQAYDGVVILENIGALPAEAQETLLQVLQTNTLPGVSEGIQVQFISTSDQDMTEAVRAGQFSEELFYRLFVSPITVPPLRERSHDVLLLAAHFRFAYIQAHPEAKRRRFSRATRQALYAYQWPGNVKELEATVVQALEAESEHAAIEPEDLFSATVLETLDLDDVPVEEKVEDETALVEAPEAEADQPQGAAEVSADAPSEQSAEAAYDTSVVFNGAVKGIRLATSRPTAHAQPIQLGAVGMPYSTR